MIRSRAYLWFGFLGVVLLAPALASRRGLAFDNPGIPWSPWQTQNLSTGGQKEGAWASMVSELHPCSSPTTVCSRIHIAHQNTAAEALIYTRSDDGGATFSSTIVEGGSAGDDRVGTYVTTAVGTLGSPIMISYRDETTGRLRLARSVTSGTGNCGYLKGWICDDVGPKGIHAALALDHDERASIFYTTASGDSVRHVWAEAPYATADFVHPIDNLNFWIVDPNPGAAVNSLAVAVDELDQVHLVYSTSRCVYYRRWFGTGVVPAPSYTPREKVECLPDSATALHTGNLSITVDAGRRPHVAFVSNATVSGGYRVRYATKANVDDPESAWNVSTVANATAPQTGTSILLSADRLDLGAISWGDTVGGVRRLYVRYPSTAALGGWVTEIADSAGGAFSALARTGGHLIVAHQRGGFDELHFSKRN